MSDEKIFHRNEVAKAAKNEFHNSQNVHGDELQHCEHDAKMQKAEIKEIINGMHCFTSCEILVQMKKPWPPITSVRRSVSNLKKAGEIFCTGERRPSLYGGKEFVHRKVTTDYTPEVELGLREWMKIYRPATLETYENYIKEIRGNNEKS